MCIDWTKINKEDYLRFMALSPVEGKYLNSLLKTALTNQIQNRIIYVSGINRSYEYESEDSNT